ncbi:MAG: MBL fold metallo-hydrolase [Proteobacteria bacterium]|nr:MBL fold metallo-hydrolase [Pseudomonadota bacterium]MBU1688952.1 MBL fold metallo-hydrolase [Pseudomonadota bacterium]
MFLEAITVGSMSVCCYILACEETRQGVIIDPGGDEDLILSRCKAEKIQVTAIINTHGHPDHVCANAPIKKATGAEIIMSAEDAEFFGKPDVEQYFSILGLAPSPKPDRLVKDGDLIEFGSESLKVITTPGHTPGGICLYNPPNLFTGDTLFVGGVGRTDFPGGNGQQLFQAIRDRLLILPGETVVWPGHGYGGDHSTLAAEIRTNPFLSDSSWAR